mgnify:CR=1 FL=1
MKIHPTAIISPTAQLSDDIEVGPNVIIGGQAKVGSGCTIQANAVLDGKITLGDNNTVGYGAILGAPPQDFAHSPDIESEVIIGNNNRIREYVTIHRGTKDGTVTRIGNHCFLMVGVHVGHNCEICDGAIITNNVLLAGYVHVGESAVLGGGAVFHQFMRIGARAMVAGGSRFNKDIPPYTIADSYNKIHGINAVGLKRAGLNAIQRLEIKRAFLAIYRSNHPFRIAAVEALKSEWGPEAREFFEFIVSSKRGICGRSVPRGDSGETE